MIFDAHLDLAMNAIEWNRDLSQSIPELRRREEGKTDKPGRARGAVSLPELRRGGIGICVATQLARVEHNAYSPVFGWSSPAQAWAATRGQLAWYRAMEEAGELTQIRDRATLDRHLAAQADAAESEAGSGAPPLDGEMPGPVRPVGYILSLEGADSLVTLQHLERSYAEGLRAIGPAHYGPGVYAFGTDSSGGFNARGRALLQEIARLGLILDVTHLCDECFWEALDLFAGPLWASHQNCRALVPHMRQFSDEQLRALAERDAVIGCALDAWMLVPGWERGKTTPQSSGVTLAHFVDHIDHLCQVTGTARHAGIGTDLDGCFGTEQTPQDLETIADLRRLPAMLEVRGYRPEEIEGICSANFIRFLRNAWT